jgi:hypothetical protein
MAKYRFKVNLDKLGVSKYFHFNTNFREKIVKGENEESEPQKVNFESTIEETTDKINPTKPFERTIAALKEIPEVNAPMQKLEYIYQVFNNLMISEIDDFWKPAGDAVKGSDLEIDYENLNGIAIYVALKANLPILIVDILFIENFVSQAILSTNRSYQMTVLHSALAFIEENLPTYYDGKDKNNPLKEQAFTPKFRATQGSLPTHLNPMQTVDAKDLNHYSGNRMDNSIRSGEVKFPPEKMADDKLEDMLFFVEYQDANKPKAFNKFA